MDLMLESDDEFSVGESDKAPIRRRRNVQRIARRPITSRKLKGLKKTFQNPPKLTFEGVMAELDEFPQPRYQGDILGLRLSDIFSRLFFDSIYQRKPNWKKLKYLTAFQKIREALGAREELDIAERFRDMLFFLFFYYCTCIPAFSRDLFLASYQRQKRIAWLEFHFPKRVPGPIIASTGNIVCSDSWCCRRPQIDLDLCWGLSSRDAIKMEVHLIIEGKSRLQQGDRVGRLPDGYDEHGFFYDRHNSDST